MKHYFVLIMAFLATGLTGCGNSSSKSSNSNSTQQALVYYYNTSQHTTLYGVDMPNNLIPSSTIQVKANHENMISNLYADEGCTKLIGVLFALFDDQRFDGYRYTTANYFIRLQPTNLAGSANSAGQPNFNYDNGANDEQTNQSLYMAANRILELNDSNANLIKGGSVIKGIVYGGSGQFDQKQGNFKLTALSDTLRKFEVWLN